jgi:uncharacterized protein (TIGR02246 family)
VTKSPASDAATEREVREVYRQLLESWDKRNARDYAALFTADAYLVGFDGSQVFGQSEIGSHVTKVFSHHQTGRYASIVRAVQSLTGDVAMLSGVAGMVPAGKDELEPSLNAIQTMVAVREGNAWKIALFQNTPAAWHGRTEDSKNLTEELRKALEPRPKT